MQTPTLGTAHGGESAGKTGFLRQLLPGNNLSEFAKRHGGRRQSSRVALVALMAVVTLAVIVNGLTAPDVPLWDDPFMKKAELFFPIIYALVLSPFHRLRYSLAIIALMVTATAVEILLS